MEHAIVGPSRVEVVRGDITDQQVDAIVNAANSSLLGGGGVDGAIHRRGGPVILAECRAIVARVGGCKAGDAVLTGGGALSARFVVHTVGPVWQGGRKGEDVILARCWTRSLELAAKAGARTVAFPAVSTGAYGYPMDQAAAVSLRAVGDYLRAAPGTVELVRVVLLRADDVATWRGSYGALLPREP